MTRIAAPKQLNGATPTVLLGHVVGVLRDPDVRAVWREATRACSKAVDPVKSATVAVAAACGATATTWRRLR